MATDGPSGWSTRTLFELADYQNGMAFRPTDTRGDGLPIIKIAELNGGIGPSTGRAKGEVDARKVIHSGDLLFAWSGSVGVYRWSGPEAVLNQHIFKVTSRNGVDQRFLQYLLESQLPTFQRLVDDQATTMGHVKVSDLKRLKVLVPPLPEQRAIASILGSLDDDILIRQGGESGGLKRLFKHLMKRLLSGEWSVDHAKEWLRTTRPTVQAYDDKIELNRRMNQTLEEIARALFKFWFVDFGPVRAKAEGRWKKGESLPGMPADMWDLWPSEFEESELGGIPKGWKATGLLEIASLLSGGTPSTAEPSYWEGGIPWASGKDVASAHGGFLLQTERTVSQDGVNHSHTSLLPARTVVITARGTVGSLAVLAEPMCISQTSYGLKANGGVPDTFLRYTVENAIEGLQQESYGTIFDTITTRNLRETRIVLPSRDALVAFASRVDPLSDRVLLNLKETRTLTNTRDTLLPKLLSGEIRVPVNGGR